MSGKKAGSDGQIRKTTAEWAVDTKTYLEGMRLMDTDTGVVRVSKGTTYALAWAPSSGPGSVTSDDVSNESGLEGATVTEALDGIETELESQADDIAAVDSARIADKSELEQDILDEQTARIAADAAKGSVYRVALSLLSADPPTVDYAINQLGGSPAWQRSGDGNYSLTLTGAFTANKRFAQVSNAKGGDLFHFAHEFADADTLAVTVTDNSGNPADPNKIEVVVTIYP